MPEYPLKGSMDAKTMNCLQESIKAVIDRYVKME
jgi:hypothetical protein